MKNLSVFLSVLIAFVLFSCSGSDTYRGSWKAMDAEGNKFDIVFEAKDFAVKDSTGHTKKHEYSQNSVQIKNSVKMYGIKLGDGRGYMIHFPKSNDESVGLIKDEHNQLVYTIARKDYITYDDIYKLE